MPKRSFVSFRGEASGVDKLHSRGLLTAIITAVSVAIAGGGAAADQFSDVFLTTPFGQSLAAAPGNSWLRMNTNSFYNVHVDPALEPAGGFGSPASQLSAWSSMAWDSNRGDFILWGGGHNNYAGNEIYRWRASTQEWERASLPSNAAPLTNQPYEPRWTTQDGPMNTPMPSHTYDGNEFLPIADRFVTFGGPLWNHGSRFPIYNPDGTIERITGPYFWDPNKADGNKVGGLDGSGVDPSTPGGQMWENRDNMPVNSGPGYGWGMQQVASAYATENGKDVLYISDLGSLWKYTVNDVNNPSLDTFEQVGTVNGNTRFWEFGAGGFDPAKKLFVRTSGNQFLYWDVSGAAQLNTFFTPVDTSGTFQLNRTFGMDFDPVRNRFVLWDGNGDVWELLPPDTIGVDGWILNHIDVVGASLPMASALLYEQGILGKWKYMPGIDAFIGVSDEIDGNIWVYKPEDWSSGSGVASAVGEPPNLATISLVMLVGGAAAIRRRKAPGGRPVAG